MRWFVLTNNLVQALAASSMGILEIGSKSKFWLARLRRWSACLCEGRLVLPGGITTVPGLTLIVKFRRRVRTTDILAAIEIIPAKAPRFACSQFLSTLRISRENTIASVDTKLVEDIPLVIVHQNNALVQQAIGMLQTGQFFAAVAVGRLLKYGAALIEFGVLLSLGHIDECRRWLSNELPARIFRCWCMWHWKSTQ